MAKPTTDRNAVRALLGRKRAALDPAEHGLPAPSGRGRRAAGGGTSQEQIDQRLHLAHGTYQAIESGRRRNVPADQLEAVARLLDLTEHEWEMLWAVQRGEQPPYPLTRCAGTVVPGEWMDALTGIDHPAYISDRSWNVLAHNDALPALFPAGRVPENTMRWMLLDPAARGDLTAGIEGVLTDWEERWAPMIVPQLRSAVAALPDDKTLAQLEADVLADPVAGPIYEHCAEVYVHPDGAIRPLRHATHGPGWVSLCTAEPLAAPRAHLMIIVYRPGDPPDRRTPLRALSAPACTTHQGHRPYVS